MLVELLTLEVFPTEEEDAVLPLFTDPALISGHLYPSGGCILNEVCVLCFSFIEH